jgi:hypothetical protein
LSRNKERLGAAQPDTSPPPAHVMQGDPGGFSFVVPTEFVELPSGGRYYGEDHPLHGQDSLEIKQMTAKEEDILTSRTLLKKGVALDRVIQCLIVDKRIDPDSLLVGDRNAIIVAMRVSGYGGDYTTTVTCPACTETQEHFFNLNEVGVYAGDDYGDLGITQNDDGTFDTVLPKTEITVTFKLLDGNDEKSLINGMESDRKRKIPERAVTRQLANVVVAVNGDDSVEALEYLLINIPSMDSRHIRQAYQAAAPNIDLTQHFECSECGHEQPMEVPLSAEFFWPDR